MEHIYQPGQKGQPVFILLHGTGGDEQSLLPIAQFLDASFGVLSIRGTVNEAGALRFFKRKAEGIYDIDDLKKRAMALKQFIIEASQQYQFDLSRAILVGFSNGANIAVEMLLNDDKDLRQAVLMAPMFPVPVEAAHSLSHQTLFISMGKNDPIVPITESEHVLDLFSSRGANLTTFWVNSHEVNPTLLRNVRAWLKTNA